MEDVRPFDDKFPYGLSGTPSGSTEALSDGVVKQLEFALTVGLLNDGDKLPSEPRLAEQLGVSTVTLRQGLAKLRTRGVLVTQRGRGGGSYLRDSQKINTERAEELLRSTSSGDLRDLGDLFAGNVARSAQLAAMRSLPDEVVRLEQLVAALTSASTPNSRRRAYCRLHIELAVAAQSSRLMLASVQLLGEVAPLLWNSDIAADTDFRAGYAAVVDAVRSRDADGAQNLARSQIEREARLLIEHHLRIAARRP
ncbi:MAG: FadR/GntR family transcriptional regulator [Leucobacter sp.]